MKVQGYRSGGKETKLEKQIFYILNNYFPDVSVLKSRIAKHNIGNEVAMSLSFKVHTKEKEGRYEEKIDGIELNIEEPGKGKTLTSEIFLG
jgi:hypothetical protein